MRHGNSGRKFGRNTSHRRAMFRNLTANLVLHERIETTDAKAKELRRVAERSSSPRRCASVTWPSPRKTSCRTPTRRAVLHVQRLIAAYIPRIGTRVEKGGVEAKKVDLVEKILVDLAKRFKGRPGGYTRIVKFGPRRGDNAPMVMIEFVGEMTGDRQGRRRLGRRRREEGQAEQEDRRHRDRGGPGPKASKPSDSLAARAVTLRAT